MKKLLSLLIAVAGAFTVCAQSTDSTTVVDTHSQEQDSYVSAIERQQLNEKIWGRGRFLRLGYAIAQTADGINAVDKNSFSFFITKGASYRFPSKPIAGMLKFGIDAVWFDFQFSKYKTAEKELEWTHEIVSPSGEEFGGDFNLNLGRNALTFGMGVGPNVAIAPFANSNVKGLRYLRASLYFLYSPTVGMYLCSQDDDVEVSTAFCHLMNFGGNITYRAITLGIEGRWGSGKFKPIDFEKMVNDATGSDIESQGTNKYTRKFANSRFYIQFAF